MDPPVGSGGRQGGRALPFVLLETGEGPICENQFPRNWVGTGITIRSLKHQCSPLTTSRLAIITRRLLNNTNKQAASKRSQFTFQCRYDSVDPSPATQHQELYLAKRYPAKLFGNANARQIQSRRSTFANKGKNEQRERDRGDRRMRLRMKNKDGG